MSDAITVGISRQSGLMRELSVLANNIANASTDGFKRDAAIFTEYISTREAQPSVSLGSLRAHYTDLTQGNLRRTGGTLDVAIDGEGWFAITRGREVLLTRAGAFGLDQEGRLITPEGYSVLDDGGSPIVVPETTDTIVIASDGTITADGFGIAQLGILSTDQEKLTRAGDNLWRTEGALQYAEFPRLRQGFLEASNVRPVEEMARLIEVQRLYEAGASLQSEEHDRISQMINRLGAR